MQRALLLTLTSELALLLVACGESETLTALLLLGPVLTLYIDDAGILAINGRRLPGIVRLISCCQMKFKNDKRKKMVKQYVFGHLIICSEDSACGIK